MADISKITTLDGTTYDLKDAIARSDLFTVHSKSASVVDFDASTVGLPVKSLVVHMEPKQNLHGYDHPWTAGHGSNVWDEIWEVGTVNASGKNAVDSTRIRSKNYIPVSPSTQYCIVTPTTLGIRFYDSSKTHLGSSYNIVFQDTKSGTSITTPANAAYMRFNAADITSYKNNIAINYPASVTTYSPYSNVCPFDGYSGAEIFHETEYDASAGSSVSISWTDVAGTIYAGSLDVISGKLKVYPYYSSYNGETLTGPWLSSFDAYTSGSTPTTGAEVIDVGGSLQEYQLSPHYILTLLSNYIWSDAGNIMVEYGGYLVALTSIVCSNAGQ